MHYNTIQNMFIFLTYATYTMKPNTMQLMQHNTQTAIHAMPHDTQPIPPIPPMQFSEEKYRCIAIHRCMGAMPGAIDA